MVSVLEGLSMLKNMARLPSALGAFLVAVQVVVAQDGINGFTHIFTL